LSGEWRTVSPICRCCPRVKFESWNPMSQVCRLFCRHTGIVSFQRVAQSYAMDVQTMGGSIRTGFELKSFRRDPRTSTSTLLSSQGEAIEARHVLTCAGLQSDRVARLTGGGVKPSIVPFRGTWFVLRASKRDIVKANVYPVPNPAFPFLGVHLTPTIDGEMLVGPNAALAFAREGYSPYRVNWGDLAESLAHPGLRSMLAKHYRFIAGELLREISVRAGVKNVQRYVPSLVAEDVESTRSGVRAQALGDDGSLVDDFVFESHADASVLNVRNAPSPAATSSLAIARVIADRAIALFKL